MADRDARRQEVARRVIERLRWDGNAAAQAGDWDKLANTARQLLHQIPDDPEALEWLEQVAVAEEVERELMRTAAQMDAQKARGRRSGFGLRALLMIVLGLALGGVIFLLARDQILSVANGLLSSPASPTASMPALTATHTPTSEPAATDTPVPTAPAATPTADGPSAVIDAAHGARLLAEPSIQAETLTLMDHNETITLLAIGQDRDWLYVRTELGQKGWAPASSLILDEATLDTLPVREISLPTSTPVPTHTISATSLPADTPTVIPTHTVAPTHTSTPTRTPRDTATPTRTIPTSTSAPTASRTPAPTVSAATATPAAQPALAAPTLIEPAEGATFSGGSAITFSWSWTGALAGDEFFVISIAYPHDGGTWYDMHWLKETTFTSPDYLNALITGDRVCTWNVTVMRQTGTDENGQPVGAPASPASAPVSFTWQASGGESGGSDDSGGGGAAPTWTPRP